MRAHRKLLALMTSGLCAATVPARAGAPPPPPAKMTTKDGGAARAVVVQASKQPQARAIETSSFADLQPPGATSPATPSAAPQAAAPQPVLIKIQALLDRAHFSPGVIDGKPGSNLNNALAAYARARHLPFNNEITPQVFAALTAADKLPITQDYRITVADQKGPFIGALPTDFAEQAKLKRLGYRNSTQELAEKFHMSETLLQTLNPGVDFGIAGTTVLVVQPSDDDIGDGVARVEVDKSNNQLRLFDGGGQLLAAFPATVGSTERPAPEGTWAVEFTTFNPNYTYDPKRLTFGKKSDGALTIAPGPNNPVGSTWIELTNPTYGIHGSPDPILVGKTASHGCVRLTNWDASAVGHAVKKGTPVAFVGETNKA